MGGESGQEPGSARGTDNRHVTASASTPLNRATAKPAEPRSLARVVEGYSALKALYEDAAVRNLPGGVPEEQSHKEDRARERFAALYGHPVGWSNPAFKYELKQFETAFFNLGLRRLDDLLVDTSRFHLVARNRYRDDPLEIIDLFNAMRGWLMRRLQVANAIAELLTAVHDLEPPDPGLPSVARTPQLLKERQELVRRAEGGVNQRWGELRAHANWIRIRHPLFHLMVDSLEKGEGLGAPLWRKFVKDADWQVAAPASLVPSDRAREQVHTMVAKSLRRLRNGLNKLVEVREREEDRWTTLKPFLIQTIAILFPNDSDEHYVSAELCSTIVDEKVGAPISESLGNLALGVSLLTIVLVLLAKAGPASLPVISGISVKTTSLAAAFGLVSTAIDGAAIYNYVEEFLASHQINDIAIVQRGIDLAPRHEDAEISLVFQMLFFALPIVCNAVRIGHRAFRLARPPKVRPPHEYRKVFEADLADLMSSRQQGAPLPAPHQPIRRSRDPAIFRSTLPADERAKAMGPSARVVRENVAVSKYAAERARLSARKRILESQFPDPRRNLGHNRKVDADYIERGLNRHRKSGSEAALAKFQFLAANYDEYVRIVRSLDDVPKRVDIQRVLADYRKLRERVIGLSPSRVGKAHELAGLREQEFSLDVLLAARTGKRSNMSALDSVEPLNSGLLHWRQQKALVISQEPHVGFSDIIQAAEHHFAVAVAKLDNAQVWRGFRTQLAQLEDTLSIPLRAGPNRTVEHISITFGLVWDTRKFSAGQLDSFRSRLIELGRKNGLGVELVLYEGSIDIRSKKIFETLLEPPIGGERPVEQFFLPGRVAARASRDGGQHDSGEPLQAPPGQDITDEDRGLIVPTRYRKGDLRQGSAE